MAVRLAPWKTSSRKRCNRPLTLMKTSLRNQWFTKDPCIFFKVLTKVGVNSKHHCLVVSYETPTPRLANTSSISLKLKVSRWHIQIAWLMIYPGYNFTFSCSLLYGTELSSQSLQLPLVAGEAVIDMSITSVTSRTFLAWAKTLAKPQGSETIRPAFESTETDREDRGKTHSTYHPDL